MTQWISYECADCTFDVTVQYGTEKENEDGYLICHDCHSRGEE